MKKNVKKILSTVGVVLLLVVLFMVASTFSKYIAQVNGVGTAGIANWSFKVNGQEDNLGTIQLVNTYDESTLVGNKIAPGTQGSFDIVIDTTGSEVAVDYKVDFQNESNKPTNLKFSYNGTTANSLQELENVLRGTINVNSEEKTKTLTINWVWAYETGEASDVIANNDAVDTNDATLMQNYTFNVVVSGIQVMPQ